MYVIGLCSFNLWLVLFDCVFLLVIWLLFDCACFLGCCVVLICMLRVWLRLWYGCLMVLFSCLICFWVDCSRTLAVLVDAACWFDMMLFGRLCFAGIGVLYWFALLAVLFCFYLVRI